MVYLVVVIDKRDKPLNPETEIDSELNRFRIRTISVRGGEKYEMEV